MVSSLSELEASSWEGPWAIFSLRVYFQRQCSTNYCRDTWACTPALHPGFAPNGHNGKLCLAFTSYLAPARRVWPSPLNTPCGLLCCVLR